ncbi:MAG: 5-(carboxyamino)imidazole ribonucleotide synthase [Chloroflexota bacterium]|nr:5-(carboxyamino)imidazole ribonucleotide synthase [Dehalococcoidia bacterium]MDW8254538.1 5-(carboxyamino)imidazole ribonucleotide synthase [Chloroflexota bacterium]
MMGASTVQPEQERRGDLGARARCRRPFRLGVVGGGQLARMMVPPAHRLGAIVQVLERSPGSPAALAGAHETVGDWDDPATLVRFARDLDALTLDHEFVDATALAAVEAAGVRVRPGAATLRRIQDKLVQKETLAKAGLAVAPFRPVETAADLVAAGEALGWPLVLKARRGGYDGRGNRVVRGPEEAAAALAAFAARPGGLYVEGWVAFRRELAIMVVRSDAGEIVAYPPVHTIQRDNICHEVRFPCGAAEDVVRVASRAAETFGVVGALGVELFELEDGRLLVNELAPRPHNSGHYTIEACVTSQFENHVRAVLGLPLGDPSPRVPAAVMVNLLADGDGPGQPAGLADALAVPGAAVHLYGKTMARRGRKMGHITVTGAEVSEAAARARAAAAAIRFGEEA